MTSTKDTCHYQSCQNQTPLEKEFNITIQSLFYGFIRIIYFPYHNIISFSNN